MHEDRLTVVKLIKIGTIICALYFVFNFVHNEMIDIKSERAIEDIEKNDTLGIYRTRGGQYYNPSDTTKTTKK
jgi:hypothetical protein